MLDDLEPEQLRQVEILELFTEHAQRANRRALLAPSQYEGERIGRGGRPKLNGYVVFHEWQNLATWQERREAREQRRLDVVASRRSTWRTSSLRYQESNREACVQRYRDYRKRINASHARREARLAKRRERERRNYAAAKQATEQAARLAAWKVAELAKAAARTPEARKASHAEVERRRYAKLTDEQREKKRVANRERMRAAREARREAESVDGRARKRKA